MTDTYSDAYKIALITSAAAIKVADPHTWSLPALVALLHNSVQEALQGKPEPALPPKPEPFISARKSVSPDVVTCMTCGFAGKSLKRHFRTAHGQTVEQYREQWSLPETHQIVAPNYSIKRSELAKANGLGRK